MPCRGLCEKFKATKPKGIGRYFSGQKRCTTCDIFINYEGLWCPCCLYRLRSNPRATMNKLKLRSNKHQNVMEPPNAR